MRFRSTSLIIILLISLSLICNIHTQNVTCHYTCASCLTPSYYHCLTCPINRGIDTKPFTPFAGMCYCSSSADESSTGQCIPGSTLSLSSRSIVWAFIILTLLLSFFMMVVRGFRYYFIKTIEDIQELSLIIYLNMYFPQQFDHFLAQMYRFNISSFLFESMATGGLFEVGEDGAVISLDGNNVPGKYNLLFKTANFFSNMFTWTIVLLILIGVMLLVRFLKNRFVSQNQKTAQKVGEQSMNASQAAIGNLNNNESFVMSENASEFMQGSPQKRQFVKQKYQIKRISRQNPYQYNLPNFLTKLHNILNFNFLIIFVYMSLIEININIFTQMKNLNFVSSFAGFGSIWCIIFFALEIVAIVWLFYKCKNQLQKPDWMQDHSYTAVLYLIRTNFKSFSKYFFFWSSIKKILFALIIAACYDNPGNAILGFSTLQMIYLCFSLYVEPFEKRYLRLHFYTCEILKLFLFISLINFVEKYKEFTALIEMTEVFFFLFAFIFGFHFFALVFGLIIERKVYWHAMKRIYYKMKRAYKKGGTSEQELKNNEIITGYFHYVWQKDQNLTQQQSQKPKMEDISKDLKELELSGSVNMTENEKQQEQQEEKEDKWREYFYIYKNYEK